MTQNYYCIPRVFKPRPSHLFRNNGDGTFTDVSKESGIAGSPGQIVRRGRDRREQRRADRSLRRQRHDAQLPLRQPGRGQVRGGGLGAGVAYSEAGKPRSGMGVDAADFDGDGWQDLFVANIDQEFFSLYRNGGI